MTFVEAQDWMDYYKQHGTLSVTRKLEWGFALLAMLIDGAVGGKRKMEEFMPYEKKPEVENDLSEVMKILCGGK